MSKSTGGGATWETGLSHSVSQYIGKYLQSDLGDLKDFLKEVGGSLKVDEMNDSFHFNVPRKYRRDVEGRLSKIQCSLKTMTFDIRTDGSYNVLKSNEGQAMVDDIEKTYHCVIEVEVHTDRNYSNTNSSEDHQGLTVSQLAKLFKDISSKVPPALSRKAKKKGKKINKLKVDEWATGEKTYDLVKVQLVLTPAAITETNAHILVSTVDSGQRLFGKLIKMLLSKAQPGLRKAIQTNPKHAEGELFMTKGFGIPGCKHIYHVVVPEQLGSDPTKNVSTLVTRALSQANSSYECESLAFSALSFEMLGHEPGDIGPSICRAVLDYIKENDTQLKVIKLSLPTREAVQNIGEYIRPEIPAMTKELMKKSVSDDEVGCSADGTCDDEGDGFSVDGTSDDEGDDERGSSVDGTCDQGRPESFVEGDTYRLPKSAECRVTGKTTMDFLSVEMALKDAITRLRHDEVYDLPELPCKVDGDDEDRDKTLLRELFFIGMEEKVVQVPDTKKRKVRLIGSRDAVDRTISSLKKFIRSAHIKE